MPLTRYFSLIGGILLALLFISDAYLPKSPAPQVANANLPVIRIHSDRKGPAQVVYDTSLPTIVPAPAANANGGIPARAAVADVPAKAAAPDAFAEMRPSDVQQLKSEPKPPDAKPQRQRKTARKNMAPPMVLVERQPRFGLFGNIW